MRLKIKTHFVIHLSFFKVPCHLRRRWRPCDARVSCPLSSIGLTIFQTSTQAVCDSSRSVKYNKSNKYKCTNGSGTVKGQP